VEEASADKVGKWEVVWIVGFWFVGVSVTVVMDWELAGGIHWEDKQYLQDFQTLLFCISIRGWAGIAQLV
jgi:hypothetical protein